MRLFSLFAALLLALPGALVAAEPAAIRLGMVNAQTGPAAGLGSGMHAGAQALFAQINARGGVHGRELLLDWRDDGYEPARTAAQTRALLDTGEIFALFGYVGTPTSRAALPLASRARVPYLFPFSGAQVLRSPLNPWVFNIRASYLDETEALVEYMITALGLQRIALLMQDDSFGETVKGGLRGALSKRGLALDGEARFLRNSLELAPAVRTLHSQQPEAIFFVGTYLQLAEALRNARALGSRATFFTVSFVGSDEFVAAAGRDGEGVYISQVLPSPHDRQLPLVRDYQAAMQGGALGYASFEGYVDARVLVAALQAMGPEPDRRGLVKALEGLSLDLGGFRVAFSADDHQGSDAVYLTRVQGGGIVPVPTQP